MVKPTGSNVKRTILELGGNNPAVVLDDADLDYAAKSIAFGGEKLSGLGRFGRENSLDAFTTYKWISVQEEPRQYPL